MVAALIYGSAHHLDVSLSRIASCLKTGNRYIFDSYIFNMVLRGSQFSLNNWLSRQIHERMVLATRSAQARA